jgi:hypothetical protein
MHYKVVALERQHQPLLETLHLLANTTCCLTTYETTSTAKIYTPASAMRMLLLPRQ